jgi:hypothetical protein
MRVGSPTQIAPLGVSDRADSFRAGAIGRAPFGRGHVRLQVEVKAYGAAFNGQSLYESADWVDTGIAGTAIEELVMGLMQGNLYHWRARLRFDIARHPYQRLSRWITSGTNGWEEADLRMPVPPPLVLTHPTSLVMCAGAGPVFFSVAATGAVPLSYHWRKDMTPLTDGGRIFGAFTPSLNIAAPLDIGDAGSYDCVVANAIGSATSDAATLTIWPTGSGDVSMDGKFNTNDIGPFVDALFSGQPTQGNCAGDMNGDGTLDGKDIALFADLLVP